MQHTTATADEGLSGSLHFRWGSGHRRWTASIESVDHLSGVDGWTQGSPLCRQLVLTGSQWQVRPAGVSSFPLLLGNGDREVTVTSTRPKAKILSRERTSTLVCTDEIMVRGHVGMARDFPLQETTRSFERWGGRGVWGVELAASNHESTHWSSSSLASRWGYSDDTDYV